MGRSCTLVTCKRYSAVPCPVGEGTESVGAAAGSSGRQILFANFARNSRTPLYAPFIQREAKICLGESSDGSLREFLRGHQQGSETEGRYIERGCLLDVMNYRAQFRLW